MQDIHEHRIAILDFGSQYTQLIARRIREAGVFCEIFPYDAELESITAHRPKGIILSGGPESVLDAEPPQVPEALFALKVPILGICYGMQTLAAQLGGKVESSAKREFGYAQVEVTQANALLDNIEDHINAQGNGLLDVWMSHGDRVVQLPPGFAAIAATDHAPLAAMADEQRRFYGVQFHPEVTHTRQGDRILTRFVQEICGCSALWTPEKIIADSIQRLQQQLGTDEVLLALSGGVDSAVVAALLHKAIGPQLTCVFVDNGLLRLHEGDQVMVTLAQHLGVKVIRINAESRFLGALQGITDPEQKRKIIGNLFIQIFEEQAALFKQMQWLGQGTIYPDVIESAGAKTGKAHVIKSHHNVGGLPDTMRLKLVEPLRELFKDEVRRLGIELGLPYDMVYRHPFPGPGLAVRILGEVRPEYTEILRQADAIFMEELRRAGWYEKVSQAFTVFLPVKSVGVVGDRRQYAFVVSLRAVETIDFMTARWAELPYSLLDQVSRRIINEVKGIARVVYDISSKPPATIEWE